MKKCDVFAMQSKKSPRLTFSKVLTKVKNFGQPEVSNLHRAICVNEDVSCSQISVHHSHFLQIHHTLHDLDVQPANGKHVSVIIDWLSECV